MASFANYNNRVRPILENFLGETNKQNLIELEKAIDGLSSTEITIFQLRILSLLIVKLDELKGDGDQDLRAGLLNCARKVISKLYLNEEKGLRSIIVVALMSIYDQKTAQLRANISEELKLAVVQCINEALRRSTGQVRLEFCEKNTVGMIGQVIFTMLIFIEKEKYKKLVLSAIECIMLIFYVHEEADSSDIILRKALANSLFVYLPKIVTVLYKIALTDEKTGERIIATAIKALGRILCLMLEDYDNRIEQVTYDVKSFQSLVQNYAEIQSNELEEDQRFAEQAFPRRKPSSEQLAQTLNELQSEARSKKWIRVTTRNLQMIFAKTNTLCSCQSLAIRYEYACLCCTLLTKCTNQLEYIFASVLDGVIAMSEDVDKNIARLCRKALEHLQESPEYAKYIFDENAEQILDAHLIKFPRVLHRCDEFQLYSELLFIKGFLNNMQNERLNALLALPKTLETFMRCMLAAVDFRITRDLLIEEYSLREITNECDLSEVQKMPWRHYKYLSSTRCANVVGDICKRLGALEPLNRVIFDYCLELLEQNLCSSKEVIFFLMLMTTGVACNVHASRHELIELLLEEILNDKHWHLVLHPDADYRLKPDRPTAVFNDYTPGLFESALEVRKQDYDSDDENRLENDARNQRVTILDAEVNVLHTALILDALGHCATALGNKFERYLFHSLHKVLLKLSHSNTIVYQAARFAFLSLQKALNYQEAAKFLEHCADHLTFHMNSLLKKSSESNLATDILTVILQHSNRDSVTYLENVFDTIQSRCSIAKQSENMTSYLRLYNAFLRYIGKWQVEAETEIDSVVLIETPNVEDEDDLLKTWLKVLDKDSLDMEVERNKSSKQETLAEEEQDEKQENNLSDAETEAETEEAEAEVEVEAQPDKIELPRHIKITKNLLEQITNIISSTDQMHQILSLECIITGLPLLKDYEDELLPMVHLIWKPLVEKFHQKDVIVLYRCFEVLHVICKYSKDFILKRSTNDVIPFLNEFLKTAANRSGKDQSHQSQTQEFRLQVKLLKDYSSIIQDLQISGKQFDNILEIVTAYLSQNQREELQALAIQFFVSLIPYDSSFVYLIIEKKSQQPLYRANIAKILKLF